MRCLVWSTLLVLSISSFGCKKAENDADRLKRMVPGAVGTTKVSGKVLVDGKPEKDLWVVLVPADPNQKIPPRGQTDAAGNFKIGTYFGDDGAPKGEYAVTIEKLKYIKRDSDWGGPDQLKNLYNHPKDSEFKVTVADTAIVLPTYELKVEGVTAKPAPPKAANPNNEK